MVVVAMRTDPEPSRGLCFQHRERAPATSYAYGINRLVRTDTFKFKGRMVRIGFPDVVIFFRLLLNFRWQRVKAGPKLLRRTPPHHFLSNSSGVVSPRRNSSSASWASFSSAPCDRSKALAQRFSSAISSRIMAARESWSSSGSREACSRICFKSLVMVGLYHIGRAASAISPVSRSRPASGDSHYVFERFIQMMEGS